MGRATGGNHSCRLGRSLALAMVRPELAVPGNKLHTNILGAEHNVTVIEESLYDPKNERIRA